MSNEQKDGSITENRYATFSKVTTGVAGAGKVSPEFAHHSVLKLDGLYKRANQGMTAFKDNQEFTKQAAEELEECLNKVQYAVDHVSANPKIG